MQTTPLVDWSSEFVMEDGPQADGYYQDHDNFIKPYFSSEYKKDTLVVTTLIEINACAETDAAIKISSDTLYLMTTNIDSESCSSTVFSKFTYTIYNPENRVFVIVSEK